ncbi:MAG TPA: Uma2 family endonuclease, partial [Aggregatilineales bacterium]|nr:Uma2 family endonuclease [Aggregatilineales bacterium]
TQRLTIEAFIEQYAGKRYEFIDGHAIPMGPELIDEAGEVYVPPPKLIHGLIVGQITALLTLFLQGKRIGRILGSETGFYMRHNPVEIRAADVAIVTFDELANLTDTSIWLPNPPRFAVEVISEWDKAAEVRRKIRSYMANGTRLLWVVYPIDREIEIHRPGETPGFPEIDDFLDGGDALPGLSIKVAEIFSVLESDDQE